MAIREFAHAKINLTLAVLRSARRRLSRAGKPGDVRRRPRRGDAGAGRRGERHRGRAVCANYIGGENLLIRALALLRDADPGLRPGFGRLDKHSAGCRRSRRRIGRCGGTAAGRPARQSTRMPRTYPGATSRHDSAPTCPCAWATGRPHLGHRRETSRPSRVCRRWTQCSSIRACRWRPAVFSGSSGCAAPRQPIQEPPALPELHHLGDLLDYMRAHGNDLERPAARLLPAIGEMKSALEAQPGCLLAAMSGSGPTCFGIFADQAQARRAADHIAAAHSGWWVKATLFQGSPAA